ncbi:hypothetical protein [Flagellimonas sp.]|uniref:hypothetical protein n=1 Tax=Flagellimonas sp. TaxID=2058762 RepID=UPI003BB042B6
MKYDNIKQLIWSLVLVAAFSSCSNDDDMQAMVPNATCDDGIINGDETGIDCGGSCTPCETMSMDPDFSGTYTQVDFMGRPGINTTLSFDMDGQPSVKDAHNVAIPSEMVAAFQTGFQARLEQYHDVYAGKLGLDPADVDYEANILGLDAATLTTVLAADILEVAPDLPTTYFDPGTDNDNDGSILVPDGDEIALTGRKLTDDVIDVSLILFFGGAEGDRFSGQDTNMDGTADLPRLTSDGVGFTGEVLTDFPYISNPE